MGLKKIIEKAKEALKPKAKEKVALVDCLVCGGSGRRHYSDEDFDCPNCEGEGKVKSEVKGPEKAEGEEE